MPVCWRCKRRINDSRLCEAWEFLVLEYTHGSHFNIGNECKIVSGISEPPHVQLDGRWIGLCPDCRLTDSQLENMMR
jgi:hypothetical protein